MYNSIIEMVLDIGMKLGGVMAFAFFCISIKDICLKDTKIHFKICNIVQLIISSVILICYLICIALLQGGIE